jgi:catechol 2,3-dioxygenase-like lactoylglutathione lyase family enzyme
VPVHINHAIVAASDKLASARFFTDLFGRAEPEEAGPFAIVTLDDGELIQFATPPGGEISPQHLAFLVDDESSTG